MRTEARTIELPANLSKVIEKELSLLNFRLTQTEKLAQCIKDLSDEYTTATDSHRSLNIWTSNNHRAAYLTYYFPLNVLRLIAVAEMAVKNSFFSPIQQVIDVGAGMGTAYWGLTATGSELKSLPWTHVDNSLEATKWGSVLLPQHQWSNLYPNDIQKDSLGVFSYSLNEMNLPLNDVTAFDHLLIVEPATNQDGRHLLSLRQQLIAKGFNIIAPCLHNEACPLLTHSNKDWCHDRIRPVLPQWFAPIEQHLPMKNNSITFCYLLASKSGKRPKSEGHSARLIGDMQIEKGKARQMICRGPDREFLTWMKRDFSPSPIPRGLVVDLPKERLVKGQEIRIKSQPTHN